MTDIFNSNFCITKDMLNGTTSENEMSKIALLNNRITNLNAYLFDNFVFHMEAVFENPHINSLKFYIDPNEKLKLQPIVDFEPHHYDMSKYNFENGFYNALYFYHDMMSNYHQDDDNYLLNLRLSLSKLYPSNFSRENRFEIYSKIYQKLFKISLDKNIFEIKEETYDEISIFSHKFNISIISKNEDSLYHKNKLIRDYHSFLLTINHSKPFATYELSKFFFNYFTHSDNTSIHNINFVVFDRAKQDGVPFSEAGIIQKQGNELVTLCKFKTIGNLNEIPEANLMTSNSSFYDFNKNDVFPAFSRLLGISHRRIDPRLKNYYLILEKESLLSHVEEGNKDFSLNKKRL